MLFWSAPISVLLYLVPRGVSSLIYRRARMPHSVEDMFLMVPVVLIGWVAAADVQPAIDAVRVAPERIEAGMVAGYGVITDGWGIPFMMAGLILLCMCVTVYVIVSLLTPAPTADELKKMGWEPPLRSITSGKITGISDPRIIAGGLFVTMIVLYYLLR